MISCGDCEDLISAYADNELSEADTLILRRHLDECDSCTSLLHIYRCISLAVGESLVPPPKALSAGVMEKISGYGTADNRRTGAIRKLIAPKMILTRFLPAAACLALLLLTVPRLSQSGGSSSMELNDMPSAAAAGIYAAPQAPAAPAAAPAAPAPAASSAPEADNAARAGSAAEDISGGDSGARGITGRGDGEVFQESAASQPADAAPSAVPSLPVPEKSDSLYTLAEPTGTPGTDTPFPQAAGEQSNDNTNTPSGALSYAVIVIRGELPELLLGYTPADETGVGADGPLHYVIPRDAAQSLIEDLAAIEGVVVNILDENGEFADVYYMSDKG